MAARPLGARDADAGRRAEGILERTIRAHLEARLSPGTYVHCLDVAAHAMRLAFRFGVDPLAARLAGLLHDYAKDEPRDAYLSLAEAAGLEVFQAERSYPPVLHQRVGAYQVERAFGPSLPQGVCSAVACHTTGRADMDGLARCVLVADHTAPRRAFDGVDGLRDALARGAEAGFRAVLAHKRALVRRRGLVEHPWALEAYARWLDEG